MSEFAFIERIRARVAHHAVKPQDLLLGIGDDAAVLREQSGRELLITTDLLVEDVDFKLDYIPPAWLGHKALAVSLSDIAAMGGTPRFSLLTLAIPVRNAECGMRNGMFWDAFLDGYCSLAETHAVTLIGGDISGMPERLAIDSVVMGHCASGRSLHRGGARVGDAIFVTGELGGSAVGLQLLLKGAQVDQTAHDWRQEAIRAHLRPAPRVAFGQMLGQSGLVHAMLDVSDGLAQDLAHICTASGVSANLFGECIPIAESVKSAAGENARASSGVIPGTRTSSPAASLELALNGGEDFELLFAADPTDERTLQELADQCQLSLNRIGEVIAARPNDLLLLDSKSYQPAGFDHFAAG